jgi:hypothetical protein
MREVVSHDSKEDAMTTEGCFRPKVRKVATAIVALACLLWRTDRAVASSPPRPPVALPIPFVANVGQTNAAVSYYAPSLSGTVFITQRDETLERLNGILGAMGVRGWR